MATYTCKGCKPIDASIIDAYVALIGATENANNSAANAEVATTAANNAATSAGNAAEQATNAALSANAAAAAANAAGITQAEASVDSNTGTPSVDVSLVNKKLSLSFHNIKGEKGDKGDRGDGAVPVINDLVTGGTDAALSAEMGKTLNNTKQATLVSGTNIKTVNGESLLGEGNIIAGDPNAVKYVEQTLTDAQKTQARTNIDAYQKPSTGIPATDLASAAQTSLGKADTAYQKPSAGIPKLDLESGVQASLDLADSAIQARPMGEVDPTITPADYATKEELDELEAKVDDLSTGKYYGYFAQEEDLPEADVDGFAYVGEGPTYTIYNCVGGVWTSSGITVNQSPIGNEEDIDQDEDGKLQFANRVYNAQQPNGMGYVILRKDKTFAEQVTAANTIYEIRYNFDLNSASVTIPTGCVLRFCGGSINNGTLTGNDTSIYANVAEILGVALSGTWNVDVAYPEWFGAKADGTTDDSASIQKALDYFRRIYFPAATYAIKQVFPKSDSVIEFSGGCRIVASGPLTDTSGGVLAQRMIDLREVHNVTIVGNNATIDMRRADYPSEESGESRHCVAINGCQNITITDLAANNSFGDGFCLGFPMSSDYNNQNIKLLRCSADNNRRQGLSVTDGQDVLVDGCSFTNTHGTLPSAGIDIEPNYSDLQKYYIKNVSILNCKCSGNAGGGLLVSMSLKVNETYGNGEIGVVVENLEANGNSSAAIKLTGFKAFTASGSLRINKVKSSGNIFLHVGLWGGNDNFATTIDNVSFTKNVVAGTDSGVTNSIIIFRTEQGETHDNYIGGIKLSNISIANSTEQAPNRIVYINPNHDSATTRVMKNVEGLNINIGTMADSYGDFTPVFAGTAFASYDNVCFDFSPVPRVTNLSQYAKPFVNALKVRGLHIIDLGDSFSVFLGKKITFIRLVDSASVGNGTVTFTISTTTKIFNSAGKALSALSILDPEGKIVGGRKNLNGEYITFIARPNGWWIYEISKGYESLELISMTEAT